MKANVRLEILTVKANVRLEILTVKANVRLEILTDKPFLHQNSLGQHGGHMIHINCALWVNK